MYMVDWIAKLDDFLKLSERDILTHAGRISHEVAVAKAETEYEHYRQQQLSQPSEVEKHFEEAVKKSSGCSRGKRRKNIATKSNELTCQRHFNAQLAASILLLQKVTLENYFVDLTEKNRLKA